MLKPSGNHQMVSYLVAMRHIRHLVAAPDLFAICWLQDI